MIATREDSFDLVIEKLGLESQREAWRAYWPKK